MHLRFKTDFSARRDDPLPDRGNDHSELICTDMGLTLIEDVPGRAGLGEYSQDLTAPACLVIDLGVQFSVRKSAGAAFSELYIGRGIQNPGLPIPLDIPAPVLHAASPLKKERPVSVLCKHQCAEKSCGTCSDHNRSVGHLLTSRAGKAVKLLLHCGDLFAAKPRRQPAVFFETVSEFHIHCVDVEKLRLFSGVD